MKYSKAIVAGSYDPPTNGHLWVIEQAAKMFDELTIAIGYNPTKKFTFNDQERIELVKEATKHLDNVSVYILPQNLYLVDYSQMKDINYLVRGLRSVEDFNYEQTIANFNRTRVPEITTIFLMPPSNISHISSSFVKAIIGPSSWQEAVKPYVPYNVLEALKEKHNENSKV